MGVYKGCKIYGPYLRKDGRQHLCIIESNGKRKTVSYPKYLMEIYLNRYLKENETIDHIDRDFNNNDIKNLRVVDKITHAKDDAKRRKPQRGKCVWCDSLIENIFTKERSSLSRRKAGPFCSKQCSGKYGAEVQNGRKKLKPFSKSVTYYCRDK